MFEAHEAKGLHNGKRKWGTKSGHGGIRRLAASRGERPGQPQARGGERAEDPQRTTEGGVSAVVPPASAYQKLGISRRHLNLAILLVRFGGLFVGPVLKFAAMRACLCRDPLQNLISSCLDFCFLFLLFSFFPLLSRSFLASLRLFFIPRPELTSASTQMSAP